VFIGKQSASHAVVTAKPGTRRRRVTVAAATVLATLTVFGVWAVRRPLLVERFSGPDGLITNEYAHANPDDPRSVKSPVWDVTSGSLFRRGRVAWTGGPDDIPPNPTSSSGTHSDVVRALTRRGFGDVEVSFRLRIDSFGGLPGGLHEWDGVHALLRYHDEFTLYAVSIARRDGTVAIKKKLPGGPANGGNYVTLSLGKAPFTIGTWHEVAVRVVNRKAAVVITLTIDGRTWLQTTDTGSGGPPLTGDGQFGLRGDATEFELDDLVVTKA